MPSRIPDIRLLALICVTLIFAFSADSAVRAQTYDAYASTDSVTVGDRFQITVSVEHDGRGTTVFPHSFIPDSLRTALGFTLGDFMFLETLGSGSRRISDAWVVDSTRYEVTTFALDTAYVALLPVGLISDTDTLVAATPPIYVPVASLVPPDAEEIRDIAALADFPSRSWLLWGLLLAVLLAIAWWFWRRRQAEEESEEEEFVEPPDPPWDEAQRRLEALEHVDLSDPAVVKPFYVELSEILRNYLERRTRVPALESSTTELLAMLRSAVKDGLVPEELIGEVRDVLAQADMVKFAKFQPPYTLGQEFISRTRSTIDAAEKEVAEAERRRAEQARRAADDAARADGTEELVGVEVDGKAEGDSTNNESKENEDYRPV